MKKRAMKKWIPKDTSYCCDSLQPTKGLYGFKHVGHCPWRVRRMHTDVYGTCVKLFCMYTGQFEAGPFWGAVKGCGEHDTWKNEERNRQRYAKWLYRNRHNKKLQPWQTTIQKEPQEE